MNTTQKTFWEESISFGSLSVPRVMAAPLDGITDSPLRRLIRHFSPDELLYTEMRHVAAVSQSRVAQLFSYEPIEQPLAYQVSANKIDWIDEAVEKIIAHKFVMLNLNMGCPARQVISSGSGSALMAQPELTETLIKRFITAINGRIPFTVKIRAGFKTCNALSVAQHLEQLGVDGLIIHPRLQTGGFTSPLDYDVTAAIKKHIQIPLVFSGNITNYARMKKVYELTGVDGFMIGRALWGCPWKMREIIAQARGEAFQVEQKEIISLARAHLAANVACYGPGGAHHFKKQLPQYIRFVPGAAQLRAQMLRLGSFAELDAALKNIEDLASALSAEAI